MGQPSMQSQLSILWWVYTVIHVFTWIMGVDTIKRQIRAMYDYMAAGQSL